MKKGSHCKPFLFKSPLYFYTVIYQTQIRLKVVSTSATVCCCISASYATDNKLALSSLLNFTTIDILSFIDAVACCCSVVPCAICDIKVSTSKNIWPIFSNASTTCVE
ncbi:MAG: hypothetical protein ACI89T_000685 [Cognaticolwellia sp.]|jgi:hypothetical protein